MPWMLLLITLAFAKEPPPGGWPDAPATATVTAVYDGDTLTLEGEAKERVRLRWVNTPELKPAEAYGAEARDAARDFVLGRTVTLVVGETPRDGYGRIIAGVRTEQGDLSELLLERGLAHLFVIPPDHTDISKLVAAQKRARDQELGIWSTDRYQGALHITSFHANAPGDDNENVNGEYIRVANIAAEPVDLAGWKLTDASGHSFTLPTLSVPAGYTFVIHSGKGETQADPLRQLEVYLGSDTPVWNNSGDKATLFDPAGTVVDARAHEVKH